MGKTGAVGHAAEKSCGAVENFKIESRPACPAPRSPLFQRLDRLRPFKTLQLPPRPLRCCQLQLSLDIPFQDNTIFIMADEVYDGAIGIDLGMFNLFIRPAVRNITLLSPLLRPVCARVFVFVRFWASPRATAHSVKTHAYVK